MPKKQETEQQLLRLLEATPLSVQTTFLRMESHTPKTTPLAQMAHYRTFPEIEHNHYDGLIITGAPVETIPFASVTYWEELCRIMAWSTTNVRSTLHICWGAQAGLHFHHGVEKYPLPKKMFGIFAHDVREDTPLLRGFDDVFWAPHSRHTETRAADILAAPGLRLLSTSPRAGVYMATSQDGRNQIFVTGHSEYDALQLRDEYARDVSKGLPIRVPENYFPNNDPTQTPPNVWRAHAHLLFANWLQFCVQDKASG